ncbi:MAG: hypothetical protein KAT34_17935 [Candidatus Aminicenantes bacterium]|nr:hypothetical protein [Candidatus Aminicenantes bacterium]
MSRQIKTDEKYLGRLLKLIPSEMVAAYLAVQGIVPVKRTKNGDCLSYPSFCLLSHPFICAKSSK